MRFFRCLSLFSAAQSIKRKSQFDQTQDHSNLIRTVAFYWCHFFQLPKIFHCVRHTLSEEASMPWRLQKRLQYVDKYAFLWRRRIKRLWVRRFFLPLTRSLLAVRKVEFKWFSHRVSIKLWTQQFSPLRLSHFQRSALKTALAQIKIVGVTWRFGRKLEFSLSHWKQFIECLTQSINLCWQ